MCAQITGTGLCPDNLHPSLQQVKISRNFNGAGAAADCPQKVRLFLFIDFLWV